MCTAGLHKHYTVRSAKEITAGVQQQHIDPLKHFRATKWTLPDCSIIYTAGVQHIILDRFEIQTPNIEDSTPRSFQKGYRD